MIVTEEEAKGRQCRICGPVATAGAAGLQTSQQRLGFMTCSGSTCMHWRWSPNDGQAGFCGLAGHAWPRPPY